MAIVTVVETALPKPDVNIAVAVTNATATSRATSPLRWTRAALPTIHRASSPTRDVFVYRRCPPCSANNLFSRKLFGNTTLAAVDPPSMTIGWQRGQSWLMMLAIASCEKASWFRHGTMSLIFGQAVFASCGPMSRAHIPRAPARSVAQNHAYCAPSASVFEKSTSVRPYSLRPSSRRAGDRKMAISRFVSHACHDGGQS
jgi:hypothetical protein